MKIKLLLKPFGLFKKPYNTLKAKVDTSIRLKLILTFGLCFVAAIFAGTFVNSLQERPSGPPARDYPRGG